MEEIRNQISRARRRLVFQQFVAITTWTIFAGLLIAFLGLAIPKMWHVAVDEQTWTSWWIGGGLVGGLIVGGIWTYFVRRGAMEAAIEIDHRFGLKERVSSSLSLTNDELHSEAGEALLNDTSRRVARIDVSERFQVATGWPSLVPLIPAVLIFALIFVQNATNPKTTGAKENAIAAQKQVKNANEQLKKRIAERKKKAAESGLKDAEDLFKKLEMGIDKLNAKSGLDRKQAMVKLNDLKKQLEERRKQLGGSEDMKKQFNQLKNIKQGPADELARAIKNGDFKDAINEMKDLMEKIQNGDLTPEEQKKLAEQLGQMQDKMQEMVEAHERAKQEMKEKIEQLEKQGKLAEAGQMQQKLDQLNNMNQQMQQMQQMANQLGQCAKCMQNGNAQQAAQQMAQMMKQMQQMQQQMDELQTLDEMMDELADAKNSMNCDQCKGMGCQACMGQGMMGMQGMMMQQGGNGLGAGQGEGDRPEEATDTNTIDSQVRGNVRPGEAAITGFANGPNRKGMTQEDIKQQIQASLNKGSDPITNQPLPRAHREHAKEYFERFRGGE